MVKRKDEKEPGVTYSSYVCSVILYIILVQSLCRVYVALSHLCIFCMLLPNLVLLSRKYDILFLPPAQQVHTITLATCSHVTKSFGSSILINIIMISP
jgi:hypothetical protein